MPSWDTVSCLKGNKNQQQQTKVREVNESMYRLGWKQVL